jgi:retinol dehydrogenase 12
MACRTQKKAEEAMVFIKSRVPNAVLEFMYLDLADLESVRDFARNYEKKGYPIHVLMNNAGIMATPNFKTSKQDIELQFASNHLGHFYLTLLLLPIIETTAKTSNNVRIVNLSSIAHLFALRGLDLHNVNNPKSTVLKKNTFGLN